MQNKNNQTKILERNFQLWKELIKLRVRLFEYNSIHLIYSRGIWLLSSLKTKSTRTIRGERGKNPSKPKSLFSAYFNLVPKWSHSEYFQSNYCSFFSIVLFSNQIKSFFLDHSTLFLLLLCILSFYQSIFLFKMLVDGHCRDHGDDLQAPQTNSKAAHRLTNYIHV